MTRTDTSKATNAQSQCRIKVGAIDAAALGPCTQETGPRPRTRKKTLLYFGCYFSGWYNFGKIVKIVATRCHILKLNLKSQLQFYYEVYLLNYTNTKPKNLRWVLGVLGFLKSTFLKPNSTALGPDYD